MKVWLQADRDGFWLETADRRAVYGPTWNVSALIRWALLHHHDVMADELHPSRRPG